MPTDGAWVAALMRAAGVDEFRIPDEWINNPEEGSVLRYRDEVAGQTVFRLVRPTDPEWIGPHVPTSREFSVARWSS
jgi:hypothetical protein